VPSPRILVVEGDGVLASYLKDLLARMDYHVPPPVSTAEDAIRLAAALPPDLILIDLELDGEMSGVQAAKCIQSCLDVPIVYLTSRAQDRLSRQALETSPYGYLLKPVAARELESTIEMSLQRHALHLKLKERERELRTLVANVPGVVYRCEVAPPWRLTRMSEGALALTGRPAEAFTSGDIVYADIILPEDLPNVERAVADGVANCAPFHIVYRIHHTDGRTRWVQESGRCIEGIDGRPDHLDGVLIDITARRQAETLYRGVWDRSIDAMRLVDTEGRIVEVNDAFVRLFGIPRERAIGSMFTIAYHEDVHGYLLDRLWKISVNESFESREDIKIRLWDGREVWLDISTGLIDVEDGHLFLSIIRDITARRHAEEALIQSERRFSQAAELSREMIWELDPAGLYTYVSDACVHMLGYRQDEIVGKLHYFDLYPESTRKAEIARSQEAVDRRGAFHNFPNKVQAKDGRILDISTNAAPVLAEDGSLLCYRGADRDITEEKRTEARLAQAGKMESVGRLAGGVAHDFNNLLTVINGYSQLVLEKLASGDPNRGHVQEILRAGERAARLTRQLLAFSRKQVLDPRVLDLNSVIGEMRPMIERLAGDIIALVLYLDPSIEPVYADRHQMEQVVMNLAINARDAMPLGGTLLLKTATVELTDRTAAAKPSGPASGSYTVLLVTDSGTGMDEATLQRVFEPFFTTKEIGRGTGLGLSIVHGIVEQSNGFIDVRSQPGLGSTFSVFLPVTRESTGNPAAEAPVEAVMGKGTVLVVEDRPEVRHYAAEVLTTFGYKVLSAEGPSEALLMCGQSDEEIDLLLTDVSMPQLSGPELAARLCQNRPQLKVLYMSGHAGDEINGHLMSGASAGFIAKPFGPKQLCEMVRAALNGGK
jgi:PAS domain S-box-containing protein